MRQALFSGTKRAMTGIRLPPGTIRAQQVVPTQAPVVQAPVAQVVQQQVVETRVRTQEDRHGAASRAFDDPAAAALRARVTAGGKDSAGVGLNASDRPLRSAAGAPAATAWVNPGSVLGQLTAHPPTGKIVEWQSLMRTGAACVLAGAIMEGPDNVAALLSALAAAPYATLSQEQREGMRALVDAFRARTASYADMVHTQHLLACAGNGTSDPVELLRSLTRPPRSTELSREAGRAVRTLLSAVGTHRLHTDQWEPALRLLEAGLRCSVTAHLTYDPDLPDATQERTRRVRALPQTPAELAAFPSVGMLAALGGRLVSPPQPVEPTPEGTPQPAVLALPAQLQPHDAAVLQVRRHAEGDGPADRHVVVGRRPDGTAYIYNPDPRRGDFVLVVGRPGRNQPVEFTNHLQRYALRMRKDEDASLPWMTLLSHTV